MEKTKTILLAGLDILLLISFFGLILKIFEYGGIVLYGEMLILLILLCLTFVGLYAALFYIRWGMILLSLGFLLILGDLLLLYLLNKSINPLYIFSVIITAIGFILSIANIGEREEYLTEVDEEGIEEIEPKEEKKSKIK
ncbi:hypothetical protein ACFLZX_03895 [Nanoarchaeota archaeon]